ncbi:Rhizopuspepsin [Neolecta irregularis DAH-3]|uniref:Rhizopuspepsin n=1 Tax=Neolecta irregularis (strain DAH-3) TaxID=1198029 RepID=A0A1U7LQR4_NEOID|nr:Rhizopuspepsin [Neolecta irregularis DAH-3]|eukprot:OLL24997.1 Rhizopuspepsin [Neolecta irregularis DAH-3]
MKLARSLFIIITSLAVEQSLASAVQEPSTSTATSGETGPFGFVKRGDGILELPIIINKNYTANITQDLSHALQRRQTYEQKRESLEKRSLLPLTIVNHLWNSMFLSKFTMGQNEPQFNGLFDTGSATLWIQSTLCSNCVAANHNIYNPQKSSSYRRVSQTASTSYGDGTNVNYQYATDVINIGRVTQKFGLVTSINQNPDFDSIVGLGFKSLGHGENTLIDNLRASGAISASKFGVQLVTSSVYPNGAADQPGGKWSFGGYDLSVVKNKKMYTVPLTAETWWQINVPSFSIASKTIKMNSKPTIVDTGTTLILLDNSQCQVIYAALGGKMQGSGAWTYPCKNTNGPLRILKFFIGGQYFSLSQSQMFFSPFSNDGKWCTGTVQSNGGANYYILGAAFLKTVYAGFNQDGKSFEIGYRTDVAV